MIERASVEGSKLLSLAERTRLQSFNGPRRDEWLASRAAIKRLAWGQLPGVSLSSVETCDNNGDSRPACVLPDGSNYPVSVSHDHRYVLAALSSNLYPVGVDLEPVSDRPLKVIHRHFPDWPRDQEAATHLWCACEALAKCRNSSLTAVLRDTQACWFEGVGMLMELPDGRCYKIFQTIYDNRVFSITTQAVP